MDARAPNPDDKEHHGPETIGIEISCRSGCNEHGDDENGSDTLHSSDRNQGQEHHKEVVIDLDPDAHGLSQNRIKRCEQ